MEDKQTNIIDIKNSFAGYSASFICFIPPFGVLQDVLFLFVFFSPHFGQKLVICPSLFDFSLL